MTAGHGDAPRRAVFLDRDGVLIASDVVDGVPTPSAAIEVLPGVPDACTRLHEAGYVLVMVTNQPDIARGRVTSEAVHRANELLQRSLGLDDVRVCPHDDADACGCRKPAPGLLLDAAAAAGIDVTRSFMVGDRWRDIEAGRRAGAKTILVDHQYQERAADNPDAVVRSLSEAVDVILGTEGV